jgi:hypothetical protein
MGSASGSSTGQLFQAGPHSSCPAGLVGVISATNAHACSDDRRSGGPGLPAGGISSPSKRWSCSEGSLRNDRNLAALAITGSLKETLTPQPICARRKRPPRLQPEPNSRRVPMKHVAEHAVKGLPECEKLPHAGGRRLRPGSDSPDPRNASAPRQAAASHGQPAASDPQSLPNAPVEGLPAQRRRIVLPSGMRD